MQLTLREIPGFLPPWAYASAGRPDERRGRVAARRAFVELKLSFLRAAADLQGDIAHELQHRVRQACEPIELWLLRASILTALPGDCDRLEEHRLAMQTALDRIYG